jgi:hypothetical protein
MTDTAGVVADADTVAVSSASVRSFDCAVDAIELMRSGGTSFDIDAVIPSIELTSVSMFIREVSSLTEIESAFSISDPIDVYIASATPTFASSDTIGAVVDSAILGEPTLSAFEEPSCAVITVVDDIEISSDNDVEILSLDAAVMVVFTPLPIDNCSRIS